MICWGSWFGCVAMRVQAWVFRRSATGFPHAVGSGRCLKKSSRLHLEQSKTAFVTYLRSIFQLLDIE